MESSSRCTLSVICAVLVSVVFLSNAVDSHPMQQLGMYNMLQFHHGNKVAMHAMDRARRTTRHHKAATREARQTVKFTEELTLCSYKITLDENAARIPKVIQNVVCNEEACACQKDGQYKCTQVYAPITVAFLGEDGKSIASYQNYDVNYGCVCASGTGKSLSQITEQKK